MYILQEEGYLGRDVASAVPRDHLGGDDVSCGIIVVE